MAISWASFNEEESLEEQAAAEHSIDFIMEQYSLKKEDIETEKVYYWAEEDRYAVELVDLITNKSYQVALRLDENRDLSFILDVTGQFDEFGLAYCH